MNNEQSWETVTPQSNYIPLDLRDQNRLWQKPQTSRTVSRKFLEYLKERYSRASKEQMVVALNLVFTTYTNNDGIALLSYKFLAGLVGKEKEADNFNFKGRQFLADFAREVEKIQIKPYNHKYRVVRAVKVLWPKDVQEMIERELAGEFKWSGRVFWSGKEYTEKKRLAMLRRKKKIGLATTKNAPHNLTRKFIRYFNNLPESIFFDILLYFNKAGRFAIKETNKEKKSSYLRTLLEVWDSPKPFVKAVMNSSRSYPMGGNLMTVKSEIRKILTKDWIELDLRHCQLAIATKLWEIKEMEEFLESGENFWKHLAGHMKITYTKKNRFKIKQAVYATLYGASKKQFGFIFKDLGKGIAGRYLSSPMVKVLYKKAQEQLENIRDAGGARDSQGKWIELNLIEVDPGKDPAKSLLSQINQSYEAELLEPAVDLAKEYQDDPDGFYLPLYQYDGISVLAKKKGQNKFWAERVNEVVEKKAFLMGYKTKLIGE